MADPNLTPEPTTWSLYKAHLIRTQVTILVICLAVLYFAQVHPLAVAIMFVVLQVVAYMGVWMGLRAAKRVADKEHKLPLEERK